MTDNGVSAFGRIVSPTDLRLDYQRTLLPPKKYLLPPVETDRCSIAYFPMAHGTLYHRPHRRGSPPPLFGEELMTSPERSVPVAEYRQTLGERVVEYSNAKSSSAEEGPFTVGALARLNLGLSLSPKATEALQECRDLIMERDIRANNLAQTIELIHAMERSLEIIETLLNANFA